MLKFAYTILYVKDVAASVKFYENALGLKRKFIAPGNSYAELLSGETTLAFASHDLATTNLKDGFKKSDPGQKPFGIELGFTTKDVEAALKKAIKAGARS